MLKVQISRGIDTPFNLEESAAKIFGNFPLDEEEFTGNVRVVGEVVNDGSTSTIRGKIFCRKSFICDRCLVQAEENQVHEFDEDIDEYDIVDGLFDVTELVRDTLIAAQPIQKLCKPDCKGLCPKCGQDLNVGECNCTKFEVDPRLAALLNLKTV